MSDRLSPENIAKDIWSIAKTDHKYLRAGDAFPAHSIFDRIIRSPYSYSGEEYGSGLQYLESKGWIKQTHTIELTEEGFNNL